jgi:hypothetical protein
MLRSKEVRKIKKPIDSDHGIYRDWGILLSETLAEGAPVSALGE